MKKKNSFFLNRNARSIVRLVILLALTAYAVIIFVPQIVSPVTAKTSNYITDSDITAHIESEFVFDPAVPFNDVNVDTSHGIVTLTGRVTNVLAKERAARITETVRGVRSIVNRITVKPIVDKSALQLREDVKDALQYDAATQTYEINVTAYDDGHVKLTGNVDSWPERELAATVAKGVSGVTGVRNSIVVITKAQRPDSEISPEIKERLQWDTLVDNAMIDVRVKDGKAILSGIAGSMAEKRRAEEDARVAGVTAVDASALKVAKWARDEALRQNKYIARSDLEIREAVQDSLLHDPRVNAFDLAVSADNGRIILKGTVTNIQAKNTAIMDARNTVGVNAVKSLVHVRPGAKTDDNKIQQNVKNALRRNPFTQQSDISVTVKDGVIHLEGHVDSFFEKAKAENVASRAQGARSVKNNLEVRYPHLLSYNPYVTDWSIYDYPWYPDMTTVAKKSDQHIARDIKDELRWSPFVNVKDVNVSVQDGVATLTGTVSSWSEYTDARANAFEGGARRVINKLKVKQQPDVDLKQTPGKK